MCYCMENIGRINENNFKNNDFSFIMRPLGVVLVEILEKGETCGIFNAFQISNTFSVNFEF